MVHCWLERKVVGKFKGDLVVASQDVVGGRIKIVEDLPGLVFNLRAIERSIECRLGLGGQAVNALGVGVPSHGLRDLLGFSQEPCVDSLGAKACLEQSADVGGHCHSLGVQDFVTSIVKCIHSPFVVDQDAINGQEEGARPVAAGLGGEQGLSKGQGNRIRRRAVGGAWNVARHVKIPYPNNFH